MECRYCGSENVAYMGVDDGGGDYGSSVCDEYECYQCGNMFEANCVEMIGEIGEDGIVEFYDDGLGAGIYGGDPYFYDNSGFTNDVGDIPF